MGKRRNARDRGRSALECSPDTQREWLRSSRGFIFRLCAWWLLGLAALAFVPGIEHEAVRHTAQSMATLLSVTGGGSSAGGEVLRVGGAMIEIVPDCTPVMPALVLVSAILAYPSPAPWRLLGALVGLGCLWVYNLGRILGLAVLLNYAPHLFGFAHSYLWQTVTLLVVFGLFVAWLKATPPQWALR